MPWRWGLNRTKSPAEASVIMAEEYSEHLGKSEDNLAVREAQQEPLVQVLAEQQGSLLRA